MSTSVHVERQIAVLLLQLVHEIRGVLDVHLAEGKCLLEEVGEQFSSHVNATHRVQNHLTVYDRHHVREGKAAFNDKSCTCLF